MIVRGGDGYMLAVDPDDVDARAVVRHAATASELFDAGDDQGAAELCASTLQMYRGDVLGGAGDGDWVTPHRARLEAVRSQLLETWFSSRLQLGDATDAVGELEAAVAANPYQESLWLLLMTALVPEWAPS